MPRRRESNLELLFNLPWWVSVSVGVAGFLFISYAVPAYLAKASPVLSKTQDSLLYVGFLFLGICLLAAAISALRSFIVRRKTNLQSKR